MSPPAVLVLVPAGREEGGPPPPPERWPLGRAALALADEGVAVQFATRPDQRWAAVPGGWRPAGDQAPGAVYDRFPSRDQPEAWASLARRFGGLPWCNSPEVVALCADKWACQQALSAAGIEMPAASLAPLPGPTFAKPRFGSFGRGVERLPDGLAWPGPVDGRWVFQRAVPSRPGWAGHSVRVLVQRRVDGRWLVRTPAVRGSRTDPVVNVARGAVVLSPEVLGPTQAEVQGLGEAVARALARVGDCVEFGLDAVWGADGRLWPIEVNGRPRGHLAELAAQEPSSFLAEHQAAVSAPLRYLAARLHQGWTDPASTGD